MATIYDLEITGANGLGGVRAADSNSLGGQPASSYLKSTDNEISVETVNIGSYSLTYNTSSKKLEINYNAPASN